MLFEGYCIPYPSCSLVDTRNIDARDELDSGRVVGVVGTTMDIHAVYPILMHALDSIAISHQMCDSDTTLGHKREVGQG